MTDQSSSTVLAAAFLRRALSFEKAISIGLKSGEYGGRNRSRAPTAVVLRRRMRHQTIVQYASGLPCCVMAMEACCGAHHLGRILQAQGHEIRLMSPEYVRPYVKAQKNDDRDAEAIAEAASRPTMRCGLLSRAHRNVAVVALAAKMARIAWATLRRNATFERAHGAAA